MSELPLIRLREVRKHYALNGGLLGPKRLVKAVDGVSFDIQPGETFGLVGESGCGKSTVGRAILRLFDITSGDIAFAGQEIAHASEKTLKPLRRRMQAIFQDPWSSLNPGMTVQQLVAEPMKIHGYDAQTQRDRAAEMLDKVGLKSEHLTRFPHEFSGGQRQRIAIARALLRNSPILILDEATSALDTESERAIQAALDELQKNRTSLVIAHRLSTIEQADEIIVVEDGRIVERGSHSDLLEQRGVYAQLHKMQFGE